jgi:glycosyltransferase involved in cell wall biosynthesis
MTDLWVSAYAQKKGIPIICRKHSKTEVSFINKAEKDTLWNKRKSLAEQHKEILQSTTWKKNYLYDFCIVINSYNRKDFLVNLINQIQEQTQDYKVQILVFDDGSDFTITMEDVSFIKESHQGKENYWKIINKSFEYIRKELSEFYIYMPDDCQITDDFFEKAKSQYLSIIDERKICLSLHTDNRIYKTNWTEVLSEDLGYVYKTQWNDLCFIAENNFFKELDYKLEPILPERWMNNTTLSSGVGCQISKRLYSKKLNMYHVKNSLVIMLDLISEMNPESRAKDKLLSI